MQIKNIGKKLNKSLHGAADAAKARAENVELPDLKKLGDKASEQVKSVFQKRSTDKAGADGSVVPPVIPTISSRNALKVIYFLIAVDGEIYQSEEEKFDEIGRELMMDYTKEKESIIKECRSAIENAIKTEDYYDAILDCVGNALCPSAQAEDAVLTPKWLVWNLLAVAYSDENYDDAERRLLKYIVRKLDIDRAVFLEMESSILTLMEVEKELSWIKTTNRPYLEIEETVNELSGRKAVIFDSVKDLITI